MKDECPHVQRCPMFPVFTLEAALEFWKEQYCFADYTRCERYKRGQCGEPVAKNMMPSGDILDM